LRYYRALVVEIGYWSQLRKQADDITEPSAVAPDAGVYFGNKPEQYEPILKLSLASGASALGSQNFLSWVASGASTL